MNPEPISDEALVAALRNHPDPLRIIRAAKIAGPWIGEPENEARPMRETFGPWGHYDCLVARVGPLDCAWVDADRSVGDPMRKLAEGSDKAEADAALVAAGWRLL